MALHGLLLESNERLDRIQRDLFTGIHPGQCYSPAIVRNLSCADLPETDIAIFSDDVDTRHFASLDNDLRGNHQILRVTGPECHFDYSPYSPSARFTRTVKVWVFGSA